MIKSSPPFGIAVHEHALQSTVFHTLRRVVEEVPLTDTVCDQANTGWWPAEQKPRCFVERIADYLLPLVAKSYLRVAHGQKERVGPQVVGVEWWLRIAPCQVEHDMHCDKDEVLWDTERKIRHPYYGSILYLSDAGGPTVICDQAMTLDEAGAPDGFDPPECQDDSVLVVDPKPNMFVMFPGWARHGVAAQNSTGVRRTLLLNWWCERPRGMPDTPVFLPGERGT